MPFTVTARKKGWRKQADVLNLDILFPISWRGIRFFHLHKVLFYSNIVGILQFLLEGDTVHYMLSII
jgi:hypothetical protein